MADYKSDVAALRALTHKQIEKQAKDVWIKMYDDVFCVRDALLWRLLNVHHALTAPELYDAVHTLMEAVNNLTDEWLRDPASYITGHDTRDALAYRCIQRWVSDLHTLHMLSDPAYALLQEAFRSTSTATLSNAKPDFDKKYVASAADLAWSTIGFMKLTLVPFVAHLCGVTAASLLTAHAPFWEAKPCATDKACKEVLPAALQPMEPAAHKIVFWDNRKPADRVLVVTPARAGFSQWHLVAAPDAMCCPDPTWANLVALAVEMFLSKSPFAALRKPVKPRNPTRTAAVALTVEIPPLHLPASVLGKRASMPRDVEDDDSSPSPPAAKRGAHDHSNHVSLTRA